MAELLQRSQGYFFVSVRQWVIKREISSSRREISITQQVKIITRFSFYLALVKRYMYAVPYVTRLGTTLSVLGL